MYQSWLSKACGMGFYAVMALAGGAGASDWCPTPSDYAITCSNCTRTLTCNYEGFIGILGDNVYLDGNHYWIYNGTWGGVIVRGNNATIANLNIYNSRGDGISYENEVDNTSKYATVLNVFVWGAYGNGISTIGSRGHFSQHVVGSVFSGNWMGIYAAHDWWLPGSKTDVFQSSMESNDLNGFYGYNSSGQSHAYNWYYANPWNGLESDGQRRGGYYMYNNANYNGRNGMRITNSASDQSFGLYGNTGYGNGISDCDGSQAARLDVADNTWTVNNGCYTK